MVTSLEDRPSSVTFLSTPRSAALSEHGVAGVYGRRTEPSKSACRRSLSFPYKYGEVWVVLLHCRVCRQDELSVGSRQKFDWDMWW